MRIVALVTWFVGLSTAFAQEQQRRLIDRLLKPDTSLVNAAQNKKFTGEGATLFDKSAPTRSFHSTQKPAVKSFSETNRVLTPRQFAARHFRAGDSAASVASRSQLTKNDTVISTTAATAGTRVAPETTEIVTTRQYASSRLFLDKGKSARSLQTHNKPLTIEEVRELLNKSK